MDTEESIVVGVEVDGVEVDTPMESAASRGTQSLSASTSRPKNSQSDSGSPVDSAIGHPAECPAAEAERPEIANPLVATEHNCYSANQSESGHDGVPPLAPAPDSRLNSSKGPQGATGGGGRGRRSRSIGVTMKEVIGWRDRDQEFARRLVIAHEEYVSHLEDILDQKIKANDKNAAILLMFKLKKEDTTYRDKVDIKHSGGIGVAVAELSTEELLRIVQRGNDGNV